MNGTISKTSGFITGTINNYNTPRQNSTPSKARTVSDVTVQKNDANLNSAKEIRETLALLNRNENFIRTGKMTNISKNDKTGDVVVKFFDFEGNKIFQEPPEQYLKIKELSIETLGSLVDILI